MPLISKDEARRIIVAEGGLHHRQPFGKGIKAVENAIKKLGYVQIDTISVVNRAHHHILRSRVPDYQPTHLHDLQKKRRCIYEYWAHAAAFLPMEDYRFSLPVMRFFREGRDRWPKSDPKIMREVLRRVENEGPVMARDFKRADTTVGDGWWDWKPAKLALNRLFFQGDLMISHRQGFQKVYDLPNRILPREVEKNEPDPWEYAQYLIRSALKVHGIASAREIAYLRKGLSIPVAQALDQLSASSEIVNVTVKGTRQEKSYAFPEILAKRHRINKDIRFLSPFDPLVIQRDRLVKFFDFDYQIECYVPKAERRFGYYCLPILWGSKFIGRLDAKADRSSRTLHVKKWYCENQVSVRKIREITWLRAFNRFAISNACEVVHLHHSDPGSLLKKLPTRWKVEQ